MHDGGGSCMKDGRRENQSGMRTNGDSPYTSSTAKAVPLLLKEKAKGTVPVGSNCEAIYIVESKQKPES